MQSRRSSRIAEQREVEPPFSSFAPQGNQKILLKGEDWADVLEDAPLTSKFDKVLDFSRKYGVTYFIVQFRDPKRILNVPWWDVWLFTGGLRKTVEWLRAQDRTILSLRENSREQRIAIAEIFRQYNHRQDQIQ